MRRILFLLILCLPVTFFGQDTTKTDTAGVWKFSGIGTLNFSQGILSNWVEGGESSVALLTILNLNLTYKQGKNILINSVDEKYGILNSGSTVKKTEDKMELESKYGYKAINNWYYSAAANFKTQFFKGYDYPNDSVIVSDFMSPAYWIVTVGMDYKEKDNLSVFISPLTSKTTIVSRTALVDETKYGLDEDTRIKNEKGAYLKVIYKFKLDDNIFVNTKLDLFSNYSHNPQNIDINSEMKVNMKINKYLSANILLHFIYDDDIEIPVYETINGEKTKVGITKALQFKESLGIGLSYKF